MAADNQDVPKGQKFMDNLLLLFILSLLISVVLYNGWGLVEILNVASSTP
ncbi:MAG: hypothetical protein OEZ02_06690 [Anaerolineae bacterium]|nr:hypothetical protein [Anaerolineae bacterium]